MTTLTPYIPMIHGLVYLVGGYFIARLASKTVGKLIQRQQKPRYTLLIKKTTFYVVFILFIVSALRQWGFELNVLLGATGILTAAFALASQTVVSNFVSGLFLLGEETFQIGDTININGVQGEVVSINSFSLIVKQTDNTTVRIPNDLLLKSPVINLSRQKD